MAENHHERQNPTVIILTLKQHEGGIWIRRLVQTLQNTMKDANGDGSVDIQVQALEEWLAQGWLVSSDHCFGKNVMGIVNRVSDAAQPALFKACCAILGAAHSLGIPIVNGPASYALCANKWCHHILFRQAKLCAPPTMAYWNTPEQQQQQQQSDPNNRQTLLENADNGGLLVKPNAGGFGAGIARVSSVSGDSSLPTFEDGVSLVQHYVPPHDQKLYRVWFLEGKVQCAVERTLQNNDSEFTSACAGSTCSIRSPPQLKAWKVPRDIQDEIERQLLPLLKDAHCGSVEFLYSGQGERLYFDLNLLSTLPVNVPDPKQIWTKDYDPWIELALAVWDILKMPVSS